MKIKEESLISIGPPNPYPLEVFPNPHIPNKKNTKKHLNLSSKMKKKKFKLTSELAEVSSNSVRKSMTSLIS